MTPALRRRTVEMIEAIDRELARRGVEPAATGDEKASRLAFSRPTRRALNRQIERALFDDPDRAGGLKRALVLEERLMVLERAPRGG